MISIQNTKVFCTNVRYLHTMKSALYLEEEEECEKLILH